MGRYLNKNHKRCPTAVICHCLLPKLNKFYRCCGWYCTCGGRLNYNQLKKAFEEDVRDNSRPGSCKKSSS